MLSLPKQRCTILQRYNTTMTQLNLEKDKKLLVATLRKLKSSKDLSLFLDDLLTEEDPPARRLERQRLAGRNS